MPGLMDLHPLVTFLILTGLVMASRGVYDLIRYLTRKDR